MPKVFALSDPHLSLSGAKPMHVFGPRWDDHANRLAENWRRLVPPDAIVLVPGDISWGMRLADAQPDLEWLAALPGRKILVRGNHDYWWSSLAKLKALGLPDMFFVQNNHVVVDGVAVGGSRLWDFPFVKWGGSAALDEGEGKSGGERARPGAGHEDDPEKIRARELNRLSASLAGLPADAALRVAMTHYPPLGEDGAPTPLTDLIGTFGVDLCVFGHIHSGTAGQFPGADTTVGRTRYILASSDHVGHAPLLVAEHSAEGKRGRRACGFFLLLLWWMFANPCLPPETLQPRFHVVMKTEARTARPESGEEER